ncbi:MAG: flagellar hook-length control protein FliK [Deltaproteobacteria bacterium]|jgi:hypothetical protein|nr:flagellar hook-length control protein FliK [Deltaproteobacteria bacterium]
MDPTLIINAFKYERVEIGWTREAPPSGADDFERLLERSRGEADLAEAAEARRELDEQLSRRREELDEALDEARRRRRFGADGPDAATSRQALKTAWTSLPESYRGRLGGLLLAQGRSAGLGAGWELSGGGRPTELLKRALEDLGGELKLWSLDQEALPTLGQIFADSGLDGEAVAELAGTLAGGPVTLERVLLTVGRADGLAAAAGDGQLVEGGLTATAEGLNSLGQFFLSLGLSAETVKAVTSGLAPGEKLTSADLRSLLSGAGAEQMMAPCLSEGDLTSLFAAFRSMSADGTAELSAWLAQNQGQGSLDDLLGLMTFLERPKPLSADPAATAALVRNLMDQASREQELAKMPEFNEIVVKLAALGDRELGDDFAELSPALQALRGGVAGLKTGSAGEGGGNYEGGGHGGHGQDREERAQRLAALGAQSGQAAARAVGDGLFQSSLADEALSHGGGETLARQIEQKILYSARRGVRRLKMDLAPESLGRLDVELKVKGDQLTAHIKAETLEAYEALEKEISSLKESLSRAGLELALTLSFDGQKEDERAFARLRAGEAATGAATAESAAAEAEIEAAAGTAGSGGRLLDRLV